MIFSAETFPGIRAAHLLRESGGIRIISPVGSKQTEQILRKRLRETLEALAFVCLYYLDLPGNVDSVNEERKLWKPRD